MSEETTFQKHRRYRDTYPDRRTPSPRLRALEEALLSIAKNTCCDKCQEAALVAQKALASLPQVGE